jgi:hypothetical protein
MHPQFPQGESGQVQLDSKYIAQVRDAIIRRMAGNRSRGDKRKEDSPRGRGRTQQLTNTRSAELYFLLVHFFGIRSGSAENRQRAQKDFVSSIWERSVARIAVVGMGAAGALLGVRGSEVCQVPAVQVRQVVNTVGAGDALFSCFLHFYLDGDEPILALRKATVEWPARIMDNKRPSPVPMSKTLLTVSGKCSNNTRSPSCL